jgi:hypothetical protein
LVVKRAAEAAASHATQHELEGDGPRRLFSIVDLDTRPEDDAFAVELERLHLRLYSTPATDEWVASISDLWESIESVSGPAEAWQATASAMLRDPAFLTY